MHHYQNFLFVHGLRWSIQEKSRCLRDTPLEVTCWNARMMSRLRIFHKSNTVPGKNVTEDLPFFMTTLCPERTPCLAIFKYNVTQWNHDNHPSDVVIQASPHLSHCYLNLDYLAFFCFWQLESLFVLFTSVVKLFHLNVVDFMSKLFTYRQMQTVYEFGCMKNKEFNYEMSTFLFLYFLYCSS